MLFVIYALRKKIPLGKWWLRPFQELAFCSSSHLPFSLINTCSVSCEKTQWQSVFLTQADVIAPTFLLQYKDGKFHAEKNKSNNPFREAISHHYPALSLRCLYNAKSIAVRVIPDCIFLKELLLCYKHSCTSFWGYLIITGGNGQHFITFSFLKWY